MKNENKMVYVAFTGLGLDVLGVFSSNKAINKEVKACKKEILDFVKNEKVKVTVSRKKNFAVVRSIFFDTNIPKQGFDIAKIEINDSENISLGNICTVWVSYSIYAPYEPHVSLTQEEELTYLKSINCLQSNGSPIEGTSLEEFKVKH